MIVEIIKYMLSTASSAVKKTGYLHEAIAIESRYKRAKESWQPHIDNTRNQIISTVSKINKFDCIVVAGAGSLFDVPVALLAEKFNQVILIDIVFTHKARQIAGRFNNVQLQVADLSGIQDPAILCASTRNLPELDVPQLPELLSHPDLFVSVNLFSQLAVTPRMCLEKKQQYDEKILDQWCSELLNNQLQFMRQLECPVCIISDHTHHVLDQHGKQVQQNDMLYGCQLPGKQADWLWDLAPAGELKGGYRIKADVSCWLW